jgi:hypothetical protein
MFGCWHRSSSRRSPYCGLDPNKAIDSNKDIRCNGSIILPIGHLGDTLLYFLFLPCFFRRRLWIRSYWGMWGSWAQLFLCTNVAIVPLDKLCFFLAQTNKLADHVKILEIVEQLSGLQDIIVDLDCTTSIDPRSIAQRMRSSAKIIFRLVKPAWSMGHVSATRLI